MADTTQISAVTDPAAYVGNMALAREIYALADTHLGVSIGHDMSVYSDDWMDHPTRLFNEWRRTVPGDAIVLVPGDISVATERDDVVSDIALRDELPGSTKIISPGNHDRAIWETQGRARTALAEFTSLVAVKSDAIRLNLTDDDPGIVIACVRGALSPTDSFFGRHREHERDYERELHRLELALERAAALVIPGDALVVQIHYPPFANGSEPNAFSESIEQAGAVLCVYGHLHSKQYQTGAFIGERGATQYHLIAADYLNMRPLHVGSLSQAGFTRSLTNA